MGNILLGVSVEAAFSVISENCGLKYSKIYITPLISYYCMKENAKYNLESWNRLEIRRGHTQTTEVGQL